MKTPKQAKRQAKRLFQLCRTGGVLDEARLRQGIAQILARRPRGFLAILIHLRRLVQLDEQRRSALIESALLLDAPLQASIQSSLQRRYGSGLIFHFSHNPVLLAGMRVRVGSDVYDSSVLGRLNRLGQSFDSN